MYECIYCSKTIIDTWLTFGTIVQLYNIYTLHQVLDRHQYECHLVALVVKAVFFFCKIGTFLYLQPYCMTWDADTIHTSTSVGKAFCHMVSDQWHHFSLNGGHICSKVWFNFLHECHITYGHVAHVHNHHGQCDLAIYLSRPFKVIMTNYWQKCKKTKKHLQDNL